MIRAALLILFCAPAFAQSPVAGLLADEQVQAALEIARSAEPETIDMQVRLSEVAAPPFGEAERGALLRTEFERLGLSNVRVDEAGNVLGEYPGRAAGPRVVLSAHLDTVFPEGTDVRVKREGTKLIGPGIGDDARGLAVLLAVARALQKAKVETLGTITFVGTVGEEGLGDLRGAKHLFQQTLKGQIDAFVSIDGTGLAITNVGVGSYRYRVTFRGPGGHSYGSFGMANPIHALGRAIAAVAEFDVPEEPKTTFNVGRVGGGTSINSIAYEAWMEVDLRSADPEALKNVNVRLQQAVNLAAELENRQWDNRGAVSVSSQLVGSRPAGRTAEPAPIVQTALTVSKALGLETYLREGSTDANVAMELGIAAITIGGGGRGAGAHSLTEEFETTRSWQGTQRALLLTAALAQVHTARVQ